jgi:phosphoglycolate phosphatase
MNAFIFDLDGTLIDSLEDLADAVNLMLAERGYPQQPLELFPKYIGDGVHKLVERALPPEALSADNLQDCVAAYQGFYETTWDKKTKPYAGMTECLAELRRRGFKMGVLSNKPHAFTLKCCTHFFPAGTFDVVFGQRPQVPRKPDPAGAFEILREFRLPPEKCFYVGDSGIDMALAKNAAMPAVGVLWGFRGEAELRENGAQYLIDRPEELLAL